MIINNIGPKGLLDSSYTLEVFPSTDFPVKNENIDEKKLFAQELDVTGFNNSVPHSFAS